MADRLTSAMERLQARMLSHASRHVTYQRGAQSVGLRATLGSSDLTIDNGTGFPLVVQSADFIVTPSDLVIDGVPVEPAAADRITDSGGGVFEVLEIPGGMPWRFTDPERTAMRIHTKQVQ